MAYEKTDPREDRSIKMESSSLTDEQLSQHYAWPHGRSVRLNMVLSSSDETRGADSTSHTLTSVEDRRILRVIRSDADVVIVGSESVRQEGWFLPPRGRLAVLSRSGELPWDSCPDPARVTTHPSVQAIVHSLKNEEEHILCEGGPITAQLVCQQWGFDHIALTRIGTPPSRELPEFLSDCGDFELQSVLSEQNSGMTFQYWRRAVEHQ